MWIDTLRSHTRNLFHAISRKSLFGFLYWLKLPRAVKNAKRCKERSLLDLKQKCCNALWQPHGEGVQKTWFPHSTHDPLGWCPGSYADVGVELRSMLLEVDARLGWCSLAFYRLEQVMAVLDKVEITRGLQREHKITVEDRTRVDKLNSSWWWSGRVVHDQDGARQWHCGTCWNGLQLFHVLPKPWTAATFGKSSYLWVIHCQRPTLQLHFHSSNARPFRYTWSTSLPLIRDPFGILLHFWDRTCFSIRFSSIYTGLEALAGHDRFSSYFLLSHSQSKSVKQKHVGLIPKFANLARCMWGKHVELHLSPPH